jgi:hypothetical protein
MALQNEDAALGLAEWYQQRHQRRKMKRKMKKEQQQQTHSHSHHPKKQGSSYQGKQERKRELHESSGEASCYSKRKQRKGRGGRRSRHNVEKKESELSLEDNKEKINFSCSENNELSSRKPNLLIIPSFSTVASNSYASPPKHFWCFVATHTKDGCIYYREKDEFPHYVLE